MKRLILIALLSPMVYASDDEGQGYLDAYSKEEGPVVTEESLEEGEFETEAMPGTAAPLGGMEEFDFDEDSAAKEEDFGIR